MRAVGYQNPLPIESPAALVDIDVPKPEPAGRDLLVAVKAVSVNPVDTKVRRSVKPAEGAWKILGWDAAGPVTAVGPQATLFKSGDAVFYAAPWIGQEPTPSSIWYCRAETEIARLVRGGCSPDRDHGLGSAVRPASGRQERARRERHPHCRRRRRRRLDRGSACPDAHRPDRDRDRLAAGNAALGQGTRRSSRHRPPKAFGSRGRGARPRGDRLRLLDHEHGSACGGNRGADRAARPLCAHCSAARF